jgi:geranylgeranyl pyrophosphate synthase
MLSEPVWDLLSREGKSWRPLFALHLLHALGTNPGPYEALVGILSELSHTGALMIDDIEDDSSIRRGRECIHLRYGLDVTINAANTLYFLPTLLIFRHPLLTEEQKLEIQEIMMQQFVRAHYGQALDLYWSRNMSRPNLNCWLSDSPIPKILQMYQLKTAAPMEGLAEASTVIAGSGEAVRRVCIEFAGALGVAFQIVDDIHGFSTSGQWRKTAGEDLAEGKLTYVFVQALKSLKDKDRQRLIEIIGSKEMRRDTEMLEEAARLIKKSGSLDHSRLEAQTMVRKKWLKLREFVPYSEPMALIHMLYTYLLKLDFN